MNAERSLFGVFGFPIAHSFSPELHRAAFAHLEIPARYLRLQARNAQEVQFLFQQLRLQGCNITAPLKSEVSHLCARVSAEVTRTRSVNTVVRNSDGKLFGDNTDVFGVRAALNTEGSLNGARVLVIGAGGAARAVVSAVRESALKMYVCNRTESAAESLARECSAHVIPFNDSAVGEISKSVDIICNTVEPEFSPLRETHFLPQHIFLEATYRSDNALLLGAKARGARTVSPLEWLLHQGAKAFELFAGKIAPVNVMREALFSAARKSTRAIAIIGGTGSGKTSVGPLLAQHLGRPFVDLDSEIERSANRSISEIFNSAGEAQFRKLESAALETSLVKNNVLIATGAGIVTSEGARRILSGQTYCIWLVNSPHSAASRLADATETRPLLSAGPLLKRVGELWEMRRQLYAECADLIVPTEFDAIDDVTERIGIEMASLASTSE